MGYVSFIDGLQDFKTIIKLYLQETRNNAIKCLDLSKFM